MGHLPQGPRTQGAASLVAPGLRGAPPWPAPGAGDGQVWGVPSPLAAARQRKSQAQTRPIAHQRASNRAAPIDATAARPISRSSII